MPSGEFYRGGNSLKPRSQDVRIDPTNGLLRPTHGISVFDEPEGLDRFGGAYRVTGVPDTLRLSGGAKIHIILKSSRLSR